MMMFDTHHSWVGCQSGGGGGGEGWEGGVAVVRNTEWWAAVTLMVMGSNMW